VEVSSRDSSPLAAANAPHASEPGGSSAIITSASPPRVPHCLPPWKQPVTSRLWWAMSSAPWLRSLLLWRPLWISCQHRWQRWGGDCSGRPSFAAVASTPQQPTRPALPGFSKPLFPSPSSPMLTVNCCIKVRLDLQADKSPVVVKGPFFPRVVNPRYRIRGTNV
jgi:hypothetical protein